MPILDNLVDLNHSGFSGAGGAGQPPLRLETFRVTGKKGGPPNLAFPRELRDELNAWPFIRFGYHHEGEDVAINLPIPLGLTFSDSASFSTINLGLIGGVVNDVVNGVNGASHGSKFSMAELAGRAGGGLGALAGAVISRASHMNSAAMLSIGARHLLQQDALADVIDYSNRQIISPNTNTTFQGTGIRSFSFVFKMIPKEQADSEAIKKIIAQFRAKLYPKGDSVIMEYPKTWEIKFYNGEGNENSYIPKIYSSYLTTFSSSYNGTSNMFHTDGSPVEVDISLGFQETKALTSKQINELL